MTPTVPNGPSGATPKTWIPCPIARSASDQITLNMQEKIKRKTTVLIARKFRKFRYAKKKIMNRPTPRSLSSDIAGSYDSEELTTAHKNITISAIWRAENRSTGSGLMVNRITVASRPISHEDCEAAIECGALRTIRKKKKKAMLKSHFAANC